MNATYSPEDNKLRLYAETRLDKPLYERVRSAGFIWAPKQELFVAPMWTPEREDLLVELCGEIGDEDTSLVDRAAERAERFEQYSENRAADADSAHKTVESICEHIPLGQPILVGHHSERRARKDAEKIENGMRRAVKMWEQSKYWEHRAAGAIAHAKYKEVPGVRVRRIKGIEADKRKMEREIIDAEQGLRFWRGEMKLINRATGEKHALEISESNRVEIHKLLGGVLGNVCGAFKVVKKEGSQSWFDGWSPWNVLAPDAERYKACPPCTVEQCRERAESAFNARIKFCNRWTSHYENRLLYERAMLAEGGGLVAQKFALGVGGQVKRRGSWYIITKVNLRAGQPISVSVIGHWKGTVQIEEIQDYKAPKEGDFEKVKAVTSTPPLCNYPGKAVIVDRLGSRNSEMEPSACVEITQAEWDSKHADYKGTRIVEATPEAGRHRVRFGMFSRKEGYSAYVPVYIIDAKRKDPPSPMCGETKPTLPQREQKDIYAGNYKAPEPTKFDAIKDALKNGVQVVTAPQLFPTPPELAKQMIEKVGILAGCRVLEPSAGTGNIVRAIINSATGADCVRVVAVEINAALVEGLKQQRNKTIYANESNFDIRCADFLECNGDLGLFDVILMNPPFVNGSDIDHILHARKFLKPGGTLVAICAGGPRQKSELEPLASLWEPLPAGTFKESGTNVNTVLLTIEG